MGWRELANVIPLSKETFFNLTSSALAAGQQEEEEGALNWQKRTTVRLGWVGFFIKGTATTDAAITASKRHCNERYQDRPFKGPKHELQTSGTSYDHISTDLFCNRCYKPYSQQKR